MAYSPADVSEHATDRDATARLESPKRHRRRAGAPDRPSAHGRRRCADLRLLLPCLAWWAGLVISAAEHAAPAARPVAVVGGRLETRHAGKVLHSAHIEFEILESGLEAKDAARYAAVILCGDAPGEPWKRAGLEGIRAYVESGGCLLCFEECRVLFAARETRTAALELLGLREVKRQKAEGSTAHPSEAARRLLDGLGERAYAWCGGEAWLAPAAGKATSLAEVRNAEGQVQGGLATVHEMGKGRIYWFGVSLARLWRTLSKEGAGEADEEGVFHLPEGARDAEAYGLLLQAAVRACRPKQATGKLEPWAAMPLGPAVERRAPVPPAVTEAVAVRQPPPAPQAELPLIVDGQAKSVLVLPDQAGERERLSARILSEHLRAMSGAAPSILTLHELGKTIDEEGFAEEGAGGRSFVWIGREPLLSKLKLSVEDLGPEGLLLATRGNVLVVSGKDDDGIRHATYALLERLGCRYLWPGDLGKVIPKRRTVSVPATFLKEAPRLWDRHLRDRGVYPESEPGYVKLGLDPQRMRQVYEEATASSQAHDEGWFAWHRLGGHRPLARGHAFHEMWIRHGEAHPEWFALQPDGTRQQNPKRPRLCHSNGALIDEIVRDRIAQLRKDPALEGVSICLNDGGSNMWCLCEACRRLDPANGPALQIMDTTRGGLPIPYVSLTDRVLGFSNRIAEGVAKAFPDRHLGMYAYSHYHHPPLRERPHPNLVVHFVSGKYLDPQAQRAMREDWLGWAAVCDKLCWRPNILHTSKFGMAPQNFGRWLLEDLRFVYNHKLRATNFDSCHHHWAQMGWVYYVLARAHWDPNAADYDALIEDYCQSGFGKAAGPIQAYLKELEAITARARDAEQTLPGKQKGVLEGYDAAAFQRLRACLREAQEAAAADPDPNAARRVAFLLRGLEFGERHWGLFQNAPGKQQQQEFLAYLKTLAQTEPLVVNAGIVAEVSAYSHKR